MDLTRELNNLLQSFKIPLEDYEEVREYLEHDEWGIALEHLIATFRDENIPISEFTYFKIKKMGEYMKFEGRPWEELKFLVK